MALLTRITRRMLKPKRLRGVLFDFDRTLTKADVTGRYCKEHDRDLKRMTAEQLVRAFACQGYDRLVAYLWTLRARNVAIGVASFGERRCILPVLRALYPMIEARFVFTPSDVVGGEEGKEAYFARDRKMPLLHRFEVAAGIGHKEGKVMLVDDDRENVRRAVAAGYIDPSLEIRNGLKGRDVKQLEELTNDLLAS